MNQLVSRTKKLKDLTYGDQLFRLHDRQVYSISDIVNCIDDDPTSKTKIYYYIKMVGYVRDEVMRKMFKTTDGEFVLYN